jgi:hypothetical protein
MSLSRLFAPLVLLIPIVTFTETGSSRSAIQHAYVRDEKRRGIAYESGGGESVQVLDGKPYPAHLRPQPSTVTR